MGGGEKSVRAEGQALLKHTFFNFTIDSLSTKARRCLYVKLLTGQLTMTEKIFAVLCSV